MQLKTDTDLGKFRAALMLAGYFFEAEEFMFNDKNKDNRRLKIWNAGALKEGTKQFQIFLGWLSAMFGERIQGFGFRDGPYWTRFGSQGGQSFYVYLAL